ncbi:hypothetical protein, partial [Paenibacillus odorifer]
VMVVLLTSILTYGVRNRGCLSFIITNYKSDEQKSLIFREKFPNYSISASLIASSGATLGAPIESIWTLSSVKNIKEAVTKP